MLIMYACLNSPILFRKILFGSMVVTSYNRPKLVDMPPYRALFSGSVVATPTSDVCTLHENQGNLHEIEAQEWVKYGNEDIGMGMRVYEWEWRYRNGNEGIGMGMRVYG